MGWMSRLKSILPAKEESASDVPGSPNTSNSTHLNTLAEASAINQLEQLHPGGGTVLSRASSFMRMCCLASLNHTRWLPVMCNFREPIKTCRSQRDRRTRERASRQRDARSPTGQAVSLVRLQTFCYLVLALNRGPI